LAPGYFEVHSFDQQTPILGRHIATPI